MQQYGLPTLLMQGQLELSGHGSPRARARARGPGPPRSSQWRQLAPEPGRRGRGGSVHSPAWALGTDGLGAGRLSRSRFNCHGQGCWSLSAVQGNRFRWQPRHCAKDGLYCLRSNDESEPGATAGL